MKKVTCLKCRWVSFPLTKKQAEAEVASFNEYFDTLTPAQKQENYGGKKGDLSDYVCLRCGGSEFRPSTEEEVAAIYGCTINPVVWELAPTKDSFDARSLSELD